MMNRYILCHLVIFIYFIFSCGIDLQAQSHLRGTLKDAITGEPLIGATVLVKGTTNGTATDYEGNFILNLSSTGSQKIECRYSGYKTTEFTISDLGRSHQLTLEEETVMIEAIEVKGQRISDKQKSSPLTVESMDLIAIKETPSANFYDGLGSLKDVEWTISLRA